MGGTRYGPSDTEETGESPVNLDLEKVYVVLAEDNPFMRSLIRTVLRVLGCDHVAEAANGIEVLRLLKAGQNPDTIITNWEMPKLDGITLIRMIRDPNESPNPYVPIIMVSAYSEEHRVIQARDAGVSEFLAKPISAQLLYERIVTTIEHPRPFVKSEGFFGPDRRHRQDPLYAGTERRKAHAEEGAPNGEAAAEPGTRG